MDHAKKGWHCTKTSSMWWRCSMLLQITCLDMPSSSSLDETSSYKKHIDPLVPLGGAFYEANFRYSTNRLRQQLHFAEWHSRHVQQRQEGLT